MTVRADTLEEAEALYRQVLDSLPAWGPNGADGQEGHEARQSVKE